MLDNVTAFGMPSFERNVSRLRRQYSVSDSIWTRLGWSPRSVDARGLLQGRPWTGGDGTAGCAISPPHEQASQTRPSSVPPSSSPHRRCSSRNATKEASTPKNKVAAVMARSSRLAEYRSGTGRSGDDQGRNVYQGGAGSARRSRGRACLACAIVPYLGNPRPHPGGRSGP